MSINKRFNLCSLFCRWEFGLFVLLITEIIIFASKNSKFLMPRVLFGSINDIISICIISLFVTFVMITGGIDIQAGALVGLASILTGVLWQEAGLNIWIACFITIPLVGLCGLLSGFFIAYCKVQAMVVTLGGSFLFSGLGLLISNVAGTAGYKGISGFPDSFLFITKYRLFNVIPLQVLVFLVLAVTAYIILHKTKYGRQIFLIGVNSNAARYSGINSELVVMSTYVLSAMGAAVAGILLTSYLGTAKSDLGATLTLPIITAVVLGGTASTGGKGSIAGTALAATLIGVMRFGLPLAFKVNTQYLDIPVGLLLLLVVIAGAFLKNNQGLRLTFLLCRKSTGK